MEREPDVEIERKYLLSALPRLPAARTTLAIEQGWIPGTVILERLRCTRTPTGARYFRTIKFGAGVRRTEIEEEIAAELFARMWPLTAGRRITKLRHCVAEGDRVWEIDEFQDRALVLAELELPAVDTEVAFPAWLAPHVVREVTDDPAYVNANLARSSPGT